MAAFAAWYETVREQRAVPVAGGGSDARAKIASRQPGLFALHIHDRMKVIAKERTAEADHLVSMSDVYNEAAVQLIEDMHALLGDELLLPAGAMTYDRHVRAARTD